MSERLLEHYNEVNKIYSQDTVRAQQQKCLPCKHMISNAVQIFQMRFWWLSYLEHPSAAVQSLMRITDKQQSLVRTTENVWLSLTLLSKLFQLCKCATPISSTPPHMEGRGAEEPNTLCFAVLETGMLFPLINIPALHSYF